MNPTTLLWCVTLVAACASITSPTAEQTQQLANARQLLDSAPDQALDLVDRVLAESPDLVAGRLLAGEGSLRLARAGTFGPSNLHLLDAVRQFELGLANAGADAEPDAFLMLAECRYELGEFAAAASAADRAAEAFQAQRTAAGRRRAAEATLLAGNSDYRRFAGLRQAELDADPDAGPRVRPARDTSELALRAAARFEATRREFPAESSQRLANIHQFLGQDADVVKELERGVRQAPMVTSTHDAYIDWLRQKGQLDALVGAYGQFVREQPTLPLMRWHQGRAIYERANRLRQEGNYQAAIAGYGKARVVFGEYLVMVPEHGPDTNQWRAVLDLSIARTAADMGDLATATAKLFSAAAASPLTTEYAEGVAGLHDAFGGHFTSTLFAIHRALSESGESALADTLRFNEDVLQRLPDRFGFVYNNAALAARDLGVQVAQRGDPAAARELWERSYAHYEKAMALMPEDARITNDCGLMLVYHLDRDFDRARQLFDRAIEIGKAQLATLPADAAPREREVLEEAVGDAYQNIAVLQREHLHEPFETYRPFCEQALKYYPYQRREAAALLRTGGVGDIASTARSALASRLATQPDAARSGRSEAQQGGAAEALAKVADAVKAKLAEQDFDGALTLLDELAKQCKDHAPFHRRRGEITLQLANHARDTGRKGAELFYQDAAAALKRAVELDPEPAAPRQLLAQAQYDAGDTEAAVGTLSSLLRHLQSQGGGNADELQALHRLRANAAARAYAQKKGDNQDDKELLTAARASFRLLEEKGQLDAPLLQLWSVTEQWAGTAAEAVNVWARAAVRAPDDLGILDAMVATAATQDQLPVAVDALAKRSDAGGTWYLGKAQFLLAETQRRAGDAPMAQKTLDEARANFTASMTKNRDYRDSCEQWLAMSLGKKGNIAFWSDDLANAQTWLLDSAKLRPDRISEDLGGGETTKIGILRVADKHFRARDLGKAESIYRAAADAASGDVDLLNNAGLFARDYGNQLEREGKNREALALYEQSYKAYTRAVELDPTNVRLRNDCALIAIYHLERDWELSKTRLDTAIAEGERTLRDSPPDDPNDKQALDEAVGDCYENVALWHLKHSKDGAAAKAAALASQKHWPGASRGGAQGHLRAAERLLQGK